MIHGQSRHRTSSLPHTAVVLFVSDIGLPANITYIGGGQSDPPLCTYVRTYVRIYIHIVLYIHRCSHTSIHTYIHVK